MFRVLANLVRDQRVGMSGSILVPVSGSSTDESVFATALSIARALNAHLEFLHLRFTVMEAVARTRHMEFCIGSAVADALEHLRLQDERLALSATQSVELFCRAHGLVMEATPGEVGRLSASWAEETDRGEQRLIFHARHSDLVILGRPRHADLLAGNLIETLLMGSGRPIVIAPQTPPASATGTVVVGWKETAESARALTAALPLLKRAHKVVVVGVAEDAGVTPGVLEDVARQLRWHGVSAETRAVGNRLKPVATQLLHTARGLHAELVVVGGFGHGPLREILFGGVTRSLIEDAPVPVFMMH